MILDFEKYAAKGNEFINLLEKNLGNGDRAHASRVLRSTLRVLRNHFTAEESLQLLAQLPMAIKSVYVEGWQLNQHKRIKTIDDLLIEVILEDGESAWKDFNGSEEIISAIRAVLETMKRYVSEHEIDQALGTLPRNIQRILKATV